MASEHIKAQRREFFTVDQTAELLYVSRETLYRMMKRNEVVWITIGRRRWIKSQEIERILNPPTEKDNDHGNSDQENQ